MTKKILGIPFNNFKEKNNLINLLEKEGYKVQILDKVIYAEKRGGGNRN